jgi:hypothetical protein
LFDQKNGNYRTEDKLYLLKKLQFEMNGIDYANYMCILGKSELGICMNKSLKIIDPKTGENVIELPHPKQVNFCLPFKYDDSVFIKS